MATRFARVLDDGYLDYTDGYLEVTVHGREFRRYTATEAEYNAAGYHRVNGAYAPGCPEGHHLVPTGRWKVEDNECRQVFDVVEDELVEPQPRRWTPLTLKRGAAARGWWEQFRAILQSAEGYEDFLMCQYVAEDDPMFRPIYDALCGMFGKELVDAYLDELPTED